MKKILFISSLFLISITGTSWKYEVNTADTQSAKLVACDCCFKFVKAYVTDDIEQDLVIYSSEIENCDCQPHDACTPDESTLPNSKLDFVVEVWNYHTSGTYAGKYVKVNDASGVVVNIDPTSGNITIYTGGLQGAFRVVVMG